ncbi:hydrogenase expression/formation C-terminal domain-containing protein [Pseudomonadota bacterium]
MNEVLSFVSTGNASPILHEIKHALARLLENGETSVIDLGAMPFAPGDDRHLSEVLGEGEVSAVLNVLGESRVAETQISGVWRVDHFDQDGNIQARFIEVTFIPEILKSQREDAETGLEVLDARLIEFEDQR